MTQVAPDGSIIELGVPHAEDRLPSGPDLPVHLRRRLLITVLTLLCLLTPTASVRGSPGLDDPLWTGSVSLNGFTLGTRNLYAWRLDGKAVTALDLLTGQPRWSREITELPDSIMDLGNGVAVVTTRPVANDYPGPPATITLIRDATGERIAQTVGDYYAPSADGRLLLVFRDNGCAAAVTTCANVTAWNVDAGAVTWKLNLAPTTDYVPSMVDGRVEAIAEVDSDGTVRLRDVSTGAVTGTIRLSPDALHSRQILLLQDMFLTAQRGPAGVQLTAYRRPSLNRSWSVVVRDFTPTNDQGQGGLSLWECGPDACLTVSGASTRVINQLTGSVQPPITFDVSQRLGGGVFLANPLQAEPLSNGTGLHVTEFIVDPNGRTLFKLAVARLMDWSESGDRVLATQEGGSRTGFVVVDDRGNLRSLGSVTGTGLTCAARADILACSDPGGTLRVWHLPR